MTKKQDALLACLVLLSFISWGCSRDDPTTTLEPMLVFPPRGIQTDEAITGEALISAWNIRVVSEGLPKWASFRIVETLSAGGDVIERYVYEQVNTDPPKAKQQTKNFLTKITSEEVQIGEENWEHVTTYGGKENLYHLDGIYLTAPTGFDWFLPATIKNVQFVGEEPIGKFKTQHYTLLAFDPTGPVGAEINGDFWLSTEYRFIVKAEWELLLGSFCSGVATFELTDINVPIEILPPPTPPDL